MRFENSTIETPISFITKREDGIIEVTIKKGVEMDLENSKRNTEIHRKLTNGQKCPFLVFIQPFATISKEARDFHGSEHHSEYRLAEAVVTTSLAQRIILRFYSTMYKRKHPVRIFSTREEAEQWLKEIYKP